MSNEQEHTPRPTDVRHMEHIVMSLLSDCARATTDFFILDQNESKVITNPVQVCSQYKDHDGITRKTVFTLTWESIPNEH